MIFIKEVKHAIYKITPQRVLNAISVEANSFSSRNLKISQSIQELRTQTPSFFLKDKLFLNKPGLRWLLDQFPPTAEELMITITTEEELIPTTVTPIKALVYTDNTNFWIGTQGAYLGVVHQLAAEGATLGKNFEQKVLYTFSPQKSSSCICFDPPLSNEAKMHMARPFSLATPSIFYVLFRAASTRPNPQSVSPLESLLCNNCKFNNLLTEAGSAYPITNILRLVQSLPDLYFLHPAAEIHVQNLSLLAKKGIFLMPHTCGQLHKKLSSFGLPENLISNILAQMLVPLTTLITESIFGIINIGFSGQHYIIRNSDLYYGILKTLLESPTSYAVVH